MLTTKNKHDIPKGVEFITIDVGNEFLYVYNIDNKSYLEITHTKNGEIKNRLILL
jgi:hypothetical protein